MAATMKRKVGRPANQEKQWNGRTLAAVIGIIAALLCDVTFPAVMVGRTVDGVLDGRASVQQVDDFRTRCHGLAARALTANRELEAALSAVDDEPT